MNLKLTAMFLVLGLAAASLCKAQTISGTIVDLNGNARINANITVRVTGSVVRGPQRFNVVDLARTGGRPLFEPSSGTFSIPINSTALSSGDITVRLEFSGDQGSVILEETVVDKLDGTKSHNLHVVVPQKRRPAYCWSCCRRCFRRH